MRSRTHSLADSDIHIELFGTIYEVSGDAVGMLEVLADLWVRLLVPPNAPDFRVAIDEDHAGWVVGLPGWEPMKLEDPWGVLNGIKHSVVDHALERSQGVIPVHAALLAKDDATVIVAGPSRAGKTTLTLELLEQGWSYGSDDYSPVIAGRPEVTTFRRPLAARDLHLWQRYRPEWGPPEWLPQPTGMFQLPPHLFQEIEASTCRPTHLFFIDPDHDGEAVHALSPARAGVELSQHVRWFERYDLSGLLALTREVDSWMLSYRTPKQGAAAVTEVCRPG